MSTKTKDEFEALAAATDDDAPETTPEAVAAPEPPVVVPEVVTPDAPVVPADDGGDAAKPKKAPKPPKAVKPPRPSDGMKDMDIAALQALYTTEVQRDTKSTNRNYLMWKIRQVRKGKVTPGPRQKRAPGDAKDLKVMSLRMEETVVAKLDEARKRLGLKNRMELFRKALGAYLIEAGEIETAGLVDPK